MQTLAIVIVSWNVCSLLDRCLSSLQTALEHIQLQTEVWVVDNASSDGSAELVREKHPWVHLETPNSNLGFVRGNNLILKRFLRNENMPDFVWLLNPDTEVKPFAIAHLLDAFAQHPKAGLVGANLLNPDGSLQQSAFHFPALLQPMFDMGMLPMRFYNSRWNGRYAASDYAKSEPFQIDHPLGAAMMARGETITQVGPLDEQFVMYCEEIDWAWRIKNAGWTVWLAPQAEVVHHGGASSKQARPITTAFLWESRARLYQKYHGTIVRKIVGFLVRRHFSRQTPSSDAWETAYRRILDAWSEV